MLNITIIKSEIWNLKFIYLNKQKSFSRKNQWIKLVLLFFPEYFNNEIYYNKNNFIEWLKKSFVKSNAINLMKNSIKRKRKF